MRSNSKQLTVLHANSDADFCDHVVWTTKDMFVQRIEPDFDFWQEMVPKMQHFLEVAILPEPVGQWFSSHGH